MPEKFIGSGAMGLDQGMPVGKGVRNQPKPRPPPPADSGFSLFLAMQGNYDAVAGFYDPLSRLVFGKEIQRAHAFLLEAVPANARILIIGGGTGWILEDLGKLHNQGLHITYVEQSEKMMRRSRRRHAGDNQVTFIQAPIQAAVLDQRYDVVITPFLFDNFSAKTLEEVFGKIDFYLKGGGLWLFADFQLVRDNSRQKVLLKLMYLFFGLLCNIEASRLPDTG
jgi:ubiquinone/menaquinone biosynthesis C-methylase UbiE